MGDKTAKRRLGIRVLQSYMDFVREKRFFAPRLSSLWVLLIPISWGVAFGIAVVDFFYRHGLRRITEPPIPVISVGNLTYGGTNKTPFVEMLCRVMEERGVSVGIVSRGYGGDNLGVRVIEGGRIGEAEADRRLVGDEPLLLSARLPRIPVAVSRNRIKGLEELERRGIQLAVADDAFQHRKVVRDVDIVLIDAACAFGSGRMIPAGILREPPSALRRSHIVVITKVEQVEASTLSALREKLREFVPNHRIFHARLSIMDWALWDGRALLPVDPRSKGFRSFGESVRGRRVMAFSAIGNPDSFVRSLRQEGVKVVGERHFRDHHVYSEEDVAALHAQMEACGAEFLSCTEKDIYNLPLIEGLNDYKIPLLLVPQVTVALEDPACFTETLVECLRPHIVVASNGYGEDSIGVLLAKKLRDAFPQAEVLAFPLVGWGEPYKALNFPVVSAPSVTPSGGVLKYRLRDLWGDIRAGLFGHIRAQQVAWRRIAHKARTPLCVGDVYLLLHTLWGQGIAPLFVATAKTVYLNGHWRLERFIIRFRCRRTWTRDRNSAEQLAASEANVTYAGNPVMDLLGNLPAFVGRGSPSDFAARSKILLLPGSRQRAYDDVTLLLDAVEILQARKPCDYVMTLAPTLSLPCLVAACKGWELQMGKERLNRENSNKENSNEKNPNKENHNQEKHNGENHNGDPFLKKGDILIRLHQGEVSTAAVGVCLLIGLGGTANQLCAGMGIPVVSIDEKGKRVQKKLLGESEILVDPKPSALADCALNILTNPELHRKMSLAGKARMGEPGALNDIVRYAGEKLGWSVRCRVYERLRSVNIQAQEGRAYSAQGGLIGPPETRNQNLPKDSTDSTKDSIDSTKDSTDSTKDNAPF
ncbi:MAG: tetraacyldisaccharide 4'-kinase [Synergistaceae bacterium]|jgi:tetraacyldisaccharide 4'-kinase|nr:tetraacyldisaccharide 4'-kinase [Synergistaceae bacterium]